jgi:ribose transport system substrate-binding protein
MRGRDGLCQALLVVLLCVGLPAWARDCIGVVPAGSDAFWRLVENGALQAGQELGIDVYYRGPRREGGVATQLQVLERAVARGCKALVVAPTGKEVGERVSQLRASGIPTIYMDRDLAGGAALGLVATDNFAAGLRAGQHMVKLFNGRGQVALLRLRRGVHSTDERERGFRQAAESGGLQVVIDEYVNDDSLLAEQILTPQLTQLDGLFTPNSTSTRAVLVAMRRLQKAGQLVHIGFDGDEVLLEAMRLGDLHALLVQQPQAMGYQAVKLAHQALRTGLSQEPVHMALEARLITRDNLSEARKALSAVPLQP